MILLCVALLIILCICFSTNNVYKYWKKRGVLYVTPSYFWGNIKDVIFRRKATFHVLRSLYYADKNARYIGCYQFFNPTLLIRDPNLIKQILVNDFDIFPDHNLIASEKRDPFWANSLLLKTADQGWAESRARFSPCFTPQKLSQLIPFIKECTQNFINYVKAQPKPVTIEVKDLLSKLCNDIIISLAFGVVVNTFEDENNRFYLLGKKVSDLSGFKALVTFGYTNFPKLMEYLKIRLFDEDVSNFFEKIVRDNLKIRNDKNILRPDFLHFISKTAKVRKSEPNIDEIMGNCLTFFLAGFESLSSFLTFSIYELTVNPVVQKKLYDEITNTLVDKDVTYESISDMKYFENVLSELFRLHGPCWALERKSIKTYTIEPKHPWESPLTIEKGMCIWIPTREIHRDAKYFSDPEKFDPDRFNLENKAKLIPNTYIPFGNGPRQCIAMRFALFKVKLLLIEILKNYELVRTEKTEVPITYKTDTFFMLPKNGIFIELKPRT